MPDWVISLLPNWALQINSAASALAVAFGIVALLCTLVLMIVIRASGSVKLLGSLMVLAMAFASNNGFVYALSIFIVATLVTDLDFLEKLAAMAWNRDKYWDYRAGKASPEAVHARVTEDAAKELAEEAQSNQATLEPALEAPADEASNVPSVPAATDAAPGTAPSKANDAAPTRVVRRGLYVNGVRIDASQRLAELVNEGTDFELRVKAALAARHSPFSGARITTELSLRRADGTEVVIDAVAELDRAHYVIEIRSSSRLSAMHDASALASRNASVYADYLRAQKAPQRVVPVVIMRARHDEGWPSTRLGALILGYDPNADQFTGTEVIRTTR